MTEVIRQLTSISPTVVAVVDHDLLPSIEESWKKIQPKIQSYEQLLKPPTPKSSDPLMQESFLEFVEKQVILDVMIDPFMFRNFI